MLALRLLGGLALENPDRITLGRAAQRRRLALLAVLASPVGVGVTRERLIGLLWPDVPPDHARHRLSVALYDVRLVLGDDAIALTGYGITLKPNALRIDVSEFESAVSRADWEAATAAYTGPFLDGVYLFDSPGFEQWVEERRAGLARGAARALEHVALQRTRDGDSDGALAAWHRLTRIDRYSGRYAAGLMRAFDAAGDRASALRHAVEHEDILRADLDADPSAEVAQLVAELKRTPPAPPIASSMTTAAVPAAPRVNPTPDARSGPRQRLARRATTSAAILLALVVLTPVVRMVSSRAPQTTRSRASVSRAWVDSVLSEGEQHLRAGRFDQAVTVFERAVAADSAFALAHFRLAVATMWADRPGSNSDAPLERATARRSELDEMNRLLLDGFTAWRRGEWNHAELVYQRALTIDPTSIDARFQLGETLFHYNTPQGRNIDEARPEFERVIALDPSHYGAIWHLAQLAARDGRDSSVVALTNRLLALTPDAVRQLEVQVLRAVARDEALDPLLERLHDADESLLFGTGWRMAIFARRLDVAERVFTLLTRPNRSPHARGLGHTQLFYTAVARGRRDKAVAQLHALQSLRDAGVQPEELTLLAAASGQPVDRKAVRAAREAIERRLAVDRATTPRGNVGSVRAVEAEATLGRSYALLDDAPRAAAVATQLERGLSFVSPDSALHALATGRAASIRAILARHAGRHEDVIRWVDRSLTNRWFSDALVDPHLGFGTERYLRAEALLALGRAEEADAWFATIGQHDTSDLILMHSALLRRAELAATRGDTLVARRLRAEASDLRR